VKTATKILKAAIMQAVLVLSGKLFDKVSKRIRRKTG